MGEGDVFKQIPIRTFEFTCSVSGPLEGELKDWPANIQDTIYLALERLSHRVQLPVCIVGARCAEDFDVEPGMPGRFFVHVMASEIIAADERKLPPGSVVKDMPEGMAKLWRQ